MKNEQIIIRSVLAAFATLTIVACAETSSATSGNETEPASSTAAKKDAVPQTASRGDMSAPMPSIQPCEMLSASDVSSIIGEIKEGPTSGTALRGEPRCGYVNMEGSWVTWSLYPAADRWEWEKSINNDKSPTDIAGLGDEAFAFRRGTDSVVLVRKGGAVLEVNCSCGAENAHRIARAASGKL